MGRRASGEGSYSQASDGTWRGAIRLGVDADGRPIRRYLRAPTRTQLKAKMDRLRADQAAGVNMGAGQSLTVAAWLEIWLAVVERSCKPSTARTYRTHARYAVAAFGARRLDKLSSEQVERLYDHLIARGVKAVSVAGVHGSLRTAFREAVRRGHLAKSPVDVARPPRVQEEELVILSVPDARAVLAMAASRRNGARWHVGLVGGLRQGEVLGLQWDDIDLDAATLKVRRALQQGRWRHGCRNPDSCGPARRCPCRHSGGLIVVSPKSKAGRRTVALTAETVAALRAHRAAQAVERLQAGELWQAPPAGALHSGTGWVFATPAGKPIDPRRDWAEWKAVLAEAHVRDARLHAARHASATFMLVAGVDGRTVMGQLGWGHASLLTRYQHVVPELQQEAARRLGTLLFGTPQANAN